MFIDMYNGTDRKSGEGWERAYGLQLQAGGKTYGTKNKRKKQRMGTRWNRECDREVGETKKRAFFPSPLAMLHMHRLQSFPRVVVPKNS